MNATEVKGKDIHESATQKVNSKGLPLPKKSQTEATEFEFPEDPNQLKSIEIGQQLLRLTGYFNYTTRLLGLVESELVGLESEYKLQIHSKGTTVRDRIGGRPNTDVVEALVLKENDDLEPLYSRRVELLSIKTQLESRARIYERAYSAMSRELARREMESKL